MLISKENSIKVIRLLLLLLLCFVFYVLNGFSLISEIIYYNIRSTAGPSVLIRFFSFSYGGFGVRHQVGPLHANGIVVQVCRRPGARRREGARGEILRESGRKRKNHGTINRKV